MSTGDNKAVFLSYASQDAEAVQRIAEAMRGAGLEVWFDKNELAGGDAWDAKIRKQIKECALFVPVISANTNARAEGYFRLEWKLAVDRSHLMADDAPFLFPIVIGDVSDAAARVPDRFRDVQWTRLRLDETPAELAVRVTRLLGGAAPERSRVAEPRHEPSAREKKPAWPRHVWPFVGVGIGLVFAFRPLWSPAESREKKRKSSAPAVAEARPPVAPALPVAPAVPAQDDKAVAVLPFTNLSGDKEQEYFSDGLTEEILNALARERDLRVPGRTSSFSFKGRNASAAEIATALNVSRLVEGSVQRSGTKVRIRVSLTRVADNASEELGTFTEELADIFALQDKVARAVVEKLTRRQLASSVEVLTKNTEAYDLYLRGRALQTSSAANSPAAAKLYERAVTLDPAFALAWAQLAATKIRLYRERDNSPEIVAAARAAVNRALELKPDLPEALLIRARITRLVDLDYAAAQRDVDRAAALQPPTAELRKSQGAQALAGGNRRETARLYEEALALDPQDGDTANALAIQYLHLGLLSESDRLYVRAMKIAGADEPTPFSNRIELCTIWRGAASALQWVERAPADQAARDLRRLELPQRVGRLDEARKLADEIRRAVGDGADVNANQATQSKYPNVLLLQAIGREPWANSLAEKLRAAALKEFERGNRAILVWSNLVKAEIVLGHHADALDQLEAWRRDMQRSIGAGRLTNFNQRAVGLYAQLGKPDEELALLRELVSNGFHLGYSLRTDPLLAPLRDDARFQELMKQEEA